jgi:peptide/nickel transport system substrate-binding protein
MLLSALFPLPRSSCVPCRSAAASVHRATAMVIVSLAVAACSGSEPPPPRASGGSLVIAAFAEPDLLLPPLTLTGQGQQVVDAVFDPLADVVVDSTGTMTYRPALATGWSWSADSLAIDFQLDARARWHDGAPVTANDVRFTWQAYVDSLVGAPAAAVLRAIDSVTTPDRHTARFWYRTRRHDQFDVAVRQLRVLPAHLMDTIARGAWRQAAIARAPIGSGRFRFGSWQAGSRVEVVADTTNYRGRPRLDRVIWSIAPDPAAASMRLFAGDVDFVESIRPDAVASFASQPKVTLLRSPSLVYGFLQFNVAGRSATSRRGLFAESPMRRAIALAIDRQTVVSAVFDSLARVALGPYTRIQLGADTLGLTLPFDTTRASTLLDSLGWRRSAAGSRMRDGVPLRFTTLVPSTSVQRQRIAVLIQQMLARIGVDMQIEQVEFNVMNARLAKGDFDAAIMAIGADPALSGIRGVWSSSAGRATGGVNFGDYRNPRFDTLLDSADAQRRPADARQFIREAHRVLTDDVPAVWLYEPWNLSGISRAIQPVGMRPDGWWSQLAEWSRVERK